MTTAVINSGDCQTHGEHKHSCGRCGRVLDHRERRCDNCGADLMTMADCMEDQSGDEG
jgi:rRNA maturation endonuclease Nob1